MTVSVVPCSQVPSADVPRRAALAQCARCLDGFFATEELVGQPCPLCAQPLGRVIRTSSNKLPARPRHYLRLERRAAS